MNKRLGRGLDALLQVDKSDQILEIELSKLRANPYQPRKSFNDESIQELANSIKEHGVIQPIIVRSVLRGYEIIAGERRWRAAQLCNMNKIPVVVRDFSDQQVMEIALIENLQREDLNAIEIAQAYQSLIDQFSLTQEELSLKVGKSRSHIANFLRLLQLPNEIKDYVSRGTLSMGHARAIVGLDKDEERLEMASLTVKNGWSVRELESAIQKRMESQPKKANPKQEKKDPFINHVEDDLRNRYKTTVKIKKQKDKGKIEILFYSSDDLERLLNLLQGTD